MDEPTPISAADRIRELSAINQDISVMLESAGKAIHVLSNRPLPAGVVDMNDAASNDSNDEKEDAAHRKAFKAHTEGYFMTLQGICARLNRQAHALEEAGIIAADAPILTLADAGKGAAAGPTKPGLVTAASEGQRIKNGGLGNFDVGWLNSRGNKVGAEKEGEIMKELRAVMEKMLAEQAGGSDLEEVQMLDDGS
jgi:hypothetical protein